MLKCQAANRMQVEDLKRAEVKSQISTQTRVVNSVMPPTNLCTRDIIPFATIFVCNVNTASSALPVQL